VRLPLRRLAWNCFPDQRWWRDYRGQAGVYENAFRGLLNGGAIPQHHACALQNLLGNAYELTICPGLLLLTLPRGHPLDLQHPTPCRSCSIPEPLDTPASQRFGEAADQAP